jgi:hypothetical protein
MIISITPSVVIIEKKYKKLDRTTRYKYNAKTFKF